MYDRFGRLIHGSETVTKDVLEYVIFEKHLANIYGSWCLHGKIMPIWIKDKPSGNLTHVLEVVLTTEEDKKDFVVEDAHRRDSKSEKQDIIYDRFGKVIGTTRE